MPFAERAASDCGRSDSPSEALARPKWDTPFNRALNILKQQPVDTRPSYGRVHGVGDGATWKKYYRETTEERKERRRLTEDNIDKKVEIEVEKKSTDSRNSGSCRKIGGFRYFYYLGSGRFQLDQAKSKKRCSGLSPC